jgi:uncharacterized protein (UPF0335 family)
MDRYNHIYLLLKRFGHDAAKAVKIVIAARRKDKYARQWIGIAFAQRRSL